MLVELEFHEYGRVRPLFKGLEFDLLLPAILEMNSAAQMWVDDKFVPRSVFLWDKANNVFYLSGDESNDEFNGEITRLMAREIKTELIFRRRSYFRLRATSDAWDPKLPSICETDLAKGHYMFYSHQRPVRTNWGTGMPSGFRLEKIDEEFLYRSNYEQREFILGEIGQMWPSIEKFKLGFGFSIVNDVHVVCWCTAEYVSKGKCGIGIETLKDYQNRGLATIAASAFVEHCIANGIKPYWECDAKNLASRRVAEKVGFVRELDYPMYFGNFN